MKKKKVEAPAIPAGKPKTRFRVEVMIEAPLWVEAESKEEVSKIIKAQIQRGAMYASPRHPELGVSNETSVAGIKFVNFVETEDEWSRRTSAWFHAPDNGWEDLMEQIGADALKYEEELAAALASPALG